MLRNRLFGFGYYEGYRNTKGTTDTRVVPTAAQRAGDFGTDAAIRDPLTDQPFSENVNPAGRVNPIARRLLNDYVPLENLSSNRLSRSPNVVDDRNQAGFRADLCLSDAHSLLGRVMYGKTRQQNPLGGSNFSPAGNTALATLADVLSLFKNLRSSKRLACVQFRIEAFNALNNVRFGQPGAMIGTASFGVISTADDARLIQLGIKHTF
jgi:hypothetical protein